MIREESWKQILEIAYGSGPAKGYIWMEKDEEAKVDAGLAENPYDYSLLTAKAILNFNHDANVSIDYFSRALAIQPFDSHQLYNRGRKYLNTGRHSEGLADLELAVRLDAEDNWKWHYLGVGYWMEGRLEEALPNFVKAQEVSARHNKDLISCEADWLWTTYMHLGRPEEAAAAIADITEDTLVVPVIGDDEGYRDACLLLNGRMPVEEYVKTISSENEGGASNGLFTVAKYYYYVEQDLDQAVEWLRKTLADPIGKGWGFRFAKMNEAKWEAEYAAAHSGN